MRRLDFPEQFLWGAATASYQVEGGIEDVDWAQAAREGKVPVAGDACDHYHLYREDFKLAHLLGHNAHRFSIEWARIEPKEGEFDETAIEHYRAVLRELRKHNIEPMVTLWHFTLPLWFSESGGFGRTDAPEIFARYCAHVVDRLGDLCTQFSTMNEVMVFNSLGRIRGTWPPFRRSFLEYLRFERALIRSHIAAYKAIKEIHPAFMVSIVKHVVVFQSDGTRWHTLRARVQNYYWTHRFMDRVAPYCDTIGLNYYRHKKFGDTTVYDKTDFDWDVYPEGLYDALMLLSRYKKPIYVTEAGCADATDRIRPDYIKKSVEAVHRAIQAGVDVRGFFYWSLMDNYEWAEGYKMRFGLIEVDFETQARSPRTSAFVYREICQENALILYDDVPKTDTV